MPYAPGEIRLREKYQAPGAEHWLGTDRLGRDVLSGLIHGTRYALTIGLVAVGISLAIGLVLGGVGRLLWRLDRLGTLAPVRAVGCDP